ncbi:RNA ligase family protein [Streptomyces sp. t39]|uniref:RNA ligase family protein n=1 Tax=Streptomyces sp. t39 TaxID=1828156 RepID=UPI0011CDCF96|nr:RNA ligase family protein [Streptomyces sp. t39]TXS56433.1 kinase [Streptomyces sp. t39]
MRTHYPRTRHLPWSPGATPDDLRTTDLGGLRGREVVVTEKLDGENTTLYADGLHARSPDSAHHPSRAWVKALQGRIAHTVPEGWRICGENLYARHSLAYDDLDGYFYGFSVWDELGWCPDWDRTVRFLRERGIPAPRVLWRGVFDERALRALRLDLGRQEGYVVRTAEGFMAEEFGQRVAKWVRPGHVTTGTHWMHSAVVPNGLGPDAPLWAVRSGAAADPEALAAALGPALGPAGPDALAAALEPALGPAGTEALAGTEREACGSVETVTASAPGQPGRAGGPGADAVPDREAAERVDTGGVLGDTRLDTVLAALLHRQRRARLAAGLAGRLGLPQARRIADLVGLHPVLHRPYPDADRPCGLRRLSRAADLAALHAVARATADGREAREQVEWSALHAEEIRPLTGLAEAFADLDAESAARCRAEAHTAYADGRIGGPGEAVAATWRWRSGGFPRLIRTVGPSGSGKSTFARGLPGVDTYIGLDDLREARGSRSDQRANGEILRDALGRLDAALTGRATVVWDATSLNRQQRSLVEAVARRRDALVTDAVVLVDEDELVRRNGRRAHPVPPPVLASQLRRFGPPYPGEAHRTWYIGASGTIEEEA